MELIIGNTAIRYDIERSERAKRKRIEVTPGRVLVVAPVGQSKAEVVKFVESKRRWVYIQLEKLGDISPSLFPVNFVTGAKVPYRGRMLRLKVRVSKSEFVRYKSGGIEIGIKAPKTASQARRNRAAHRLITEWYQERIAHDCGRLIERFSKVLGVVPKGFRIKNQKHLWGSCGKDNIINLNWHLILAPRSILEYAVLHELCHLRYRNHSTQFWNLVQSAMPDYEFRKKWFERNERAMRLD